MTELDKSTFRVTMTARLRHGDLLDAIRKRKWSIKQTAKFLGVSKFTLGRIINLRQVPKKVLSRESFVNGLHELTGKLPEELWPGFVRTDEFLAIPKVIEATREIYPKFLAERGVRVLPPMPDEIVEGEDLQKQIEVVLGTLPQRLARVIHLRFFEEKSLDEVGKELGVGRERARQLESRALRKLRHPSRASLLREFLNGP